MKIAGIDASINCTAVAVADLDENFEYIDVKLYAYHTTKSRCFSQENIYVHQLNRGYTTDYIYDREDQVNPLIMNWIDGSSHVSIEDFAYDAKNDSSSVFQLAEFIGAMRRKIFRNYYPLYRYSPKSVKIYASSLHNADKFVMTRAFRNRYPVWCPEWFTNFVANNTDASPVGDMADAFWMMDVLRLSLKHKAGQKLPDGAIEPLTTAGKKKKGHTPRALVDIIPEQRVKI